MTFEQVVLDILYILLVILAVGAIVFFIFLIFIAYHIFRIVKGIRSALMLIEGLSLGVSLFRNRFRSKFWEVVSYLLKGGGGRYGQR